MAVPVSQIVLRMDSPALAKRPAIHTLVSRTKGKKLIRSRDYKPICDKGGNCGCSVKGFLHGLEAITGAGWNSEFVSKENFRQNKILVLQLFELPDCQMISSVDRCSNSE